MTEDYAPMMRRQWERWLPHRLREIADPETFFTELGREIELEVDTLALELEGADLPNESYLDRAGRMAAARRTAEEILLGEGVLAEPAELPEEPAHAEANTAMGRPPMVVTPGDPEWAEIVEEEDQARRTPRRGPSDP